VADIGRSNRHVLLSEEDLRAHAGDRIFERGEDDVRYVRAPRVRRLCAVLAAGLGLAVAVVSMVLPGHRL
jgi:hypothetical protein